MTVSYKLHSASGHPISIKGPNGKSSIEASLIPNLRCPHCMHMGAFTPVIPRDVSIQHVEMKNNAPYAMGESVVGIRVCPNSDCRGLVLVIISKNGKVASLPNEVLDFDPTNIPTAIADSLEEAVKCHSTQCYKAAALMVRRVLEELCEERAATGGNLKERLISLAKTVILPGQLIEAADHLRLLGNDAAHIDAKTYLSIGEAEVRIAIDLTKELLKATYQYKDLLSRLTSLQKAKL